MNGQNKFVNPYNFVPLGENQPKRKQPKSHEYFVGNRGRIVCRITFQTPFFIPHPEKRFSVPKKKNANQVQDDELPQWVLKDQKAKEAWQRLKELNAGEGHEMLALLRDSDDKPFIPGSSLKGTFRTIAEALSNSCLSQLEFEWELLQPGKCNDPEVRIGKVRRYYSYRRVQSPPGVGKVVRLDDAKHYGQIAVGNKRRVFFDDPIKVIDGPVHKQNLSNYKDGEKVMANPKTYHYERKVKGRNLEIPAVELTPNGRLKGILKITEVTDVKKSQRFVYWDKNPPLVQFGIEQRLAYNRANETSINQDRDKSDYIYCQDPTQKAERREAGQRRRRHELEKGDIVYFTEQCGRVIDMGPVELYRILYCHSLDEILLCKHFDFLPCKDPNYLCPSCRIFGWVPPEESKAAQETMAHKGFVHFSTARLVNNEPKTQWVTLQPLGQPHPSCWQFYLNCQNQGQDAGYNDNNATIRGRKFYWHKPQVTTEQPNGNANVNSVWDQRGGNGIPVADDQNKTVELLLPKNENEEPCVFEFTVDFENLSDEDLGLILLTLQPNLLGQNILKAAGFSSELYHHFGMGKPLGLGSAKVEIISLCLYDNSKRYQDLFETASEAYIKDTSEFALKVSGFVIKFVREALKDQGKPTHEGNDENACREFLKINHIQSLFTMLDWEKAKDLKLNGESVVRYPPGGDGRTGKSSPNMKEYWESFRWFTHRNQRGDKPRHMLPKATDIVKGESYWQDGFPPRDLSRQGQSQPLQKKHR